MLFYLKIILINFLFSLLYVYIIESIKFTLISIEYFHFNQPIAIISIRDFLIEFQNLRKNQFGFTNKFLIKNLTL